MSQLRPIPDVAAAMGLPSSYVVPWGRDRAKVELAALDPKKPRGKLVLVSAMNPTPAGEGKTTMSIALTMGLVKRGKRAVVALREPSLGPVFGVKGGGTGGGKSQLEPASDINLHFTGDMHAITSAHNLLAAIVDNAVLYRDPVELDGRTVTWPRVLDMNDRALRKVILGLGGKGQGIPRESSFDITAASEVMAILCLSESVADLRERCGRIIVGSARDGHLVTAKELGADQAMVALLKDALMPNLVQTREGTPAIVHGGPFANIAHGCNSILATKLALQHSDITITEAGFGFDLGGQKFLDLKCHAAGLWPDAVVLVATVRALKYQGGVAVPQLGERNDAALARGLELVGKHLESIAGYRLPAVVVLNHFPTDHADEVAAVKSFVQQHAASREFGAEVAVCRGYSDGGEGALEAADVLNAVLEKTTPQPPTFTYDSADDPRTQLTKIASRIYGAKSVVWSTEATAQLAALPQQGQGLRVCVAKTHLSLTDQPAKIGRVRDFDITVREVRASAGAGFLVALTGGLVTMPGLPKVPSARRVVVHDDGRVTGLMQHD